MTKDEEDALRKDRQDRMPDMNQEAKFQDVPRRNYQSSIRDFPSPSNEAAYPYPPINYDSMPEADFNPGIVDMADALHDMSTSADNHCENVCQLVKASCLILEGKLDEIDKTFMRNRMSIDDLSGHNNRLASEAEHIRFRLDQLEKLFA